jgi:hypothetical protein
MTYLKLNSGGPGPGVSVVAYPYSRSSRRADSTAPQTREASPAGKPRMAANDDDDDGPRKSYQIRNPLWVIVIALATLFTVLALVVAST